MKNCFYHMLVIGFICNYSLNAFSACQDYFRLYGIIGVKKKSWETTNVSKKSKKICNKLPMHPDANIEISLVKGKSSFTTKIFRSLNGFWDHPEKNGTWSGGTYSLDVIEVNAFVPDWYKNSTMKIKEISSNKTLVETKL